MKSLFVSDLLQITVDDIRSFYDQGFPEGLRLEYKKTLTDNLKLAETICAFANTQGGIILVGIEADTVKNTPIALHGIELKQGLEEKIVSLCLSHISPSINPEVKVYDFKSNPEEPKNDRAILLIRVRSSYNPPHYILNNNKILVRVHNRNSLADLQTIEKLIEKRKTLKSEESSSYPFYTHKEIQIENTSYESVVITPQFAIEPVIDFYTKESSDWLFKNANEVMRLHEQRPDPWKITFVGLNQQTGEITRYCEIRKNGEIIFQRTTDIVNGVFLPLSSLQLIVKVLENARKVYSHFGVFEDLVIGLTLVFMENPIICYPDGPFRENYEFKGKEIKISENLRFDELSAPQKILTGFLKGICIHFGLVLHEKKIIDLVDKMLKTPK